MAPGGVGHGLGGLLALLLQRSKGGGVALLCSLGSGLAGCLFAGVTLRNDLLLLLVQRGQPGRAFQLGLFTDLSLGGVHLQNSLHQVVHIFHAMHLTL